MILKSMVAAFVLVNSPWAFSDETDRHIGVCATHLLITNQLTEGERLLTRVTSKAEMQKSADEFTALIFKDMNLALDQAVKSCEILNQPLFKDDTTEFI